MVINSMVVVFRRQTNDSLPRRMAGMDRGRTTNDSLPRGIAGDDGRKTIDGGQWSMVNGKYTILHLVTCDKNANSTSVTVASDEVPF